MLKCIRSCCECELGWGVVGLRYGQEVDMLCECVCVDWGGESL